METIFINTKNRKTNELHKFALNLSQRSDLRSSTWNDEFELPEGSYSVSEIQDYIKYIIKKHET